MAKITIDEKEYDVQDGLTIIQACEEVGIAIPRFCYHEKLAIAGNCRMCLVEVEKSPKPVASCSINVTNGMVIRTESEMVKRAREGVMEFLLINHPLDCPICDQGGECDLQDQAVKYGRGVSRYREEKRAVENKYMGPLIATWMTRCIHCTRCVRFLEDIAGTSELGAIGRGENMEITTYIERGIASELSGNIIDLCPVGALTSKPYAYTARSWELEHTYSIDVMDAIGSHIRIDTRGNEVMRILPQVCEDINEEWISDKTRFAYDGLKYQRLDRPLIRQNDVLSPSTYADAVKAAVELIRNSDNIGIIAGKLSDVETMFAAKNFLKKLGRGYTDYEVKMHGLRLKNRSDYIFNAGIIGIETASHCLLINTNPRHEAAVLNARIRKCVVHNNLSVSFIGPKINLNYEYDDLGADTLEILIQIANGSHAYCNVLKGARQPMMIIGSDVFGDEKSEVIHSLCKSIALKYSCTFNVLHHAAGAVGALDIGFVNHKKSSKNSPQTFILLGADDVDNMPNNANVIYVGHHGDSAVYGADIILPSPAFTEKSGTYVNTEGRVQRSSQAVAAIGEALPEYRIFIDIAKNLGLQLDFENLETLRECIAMENDVFAEENLFQLQCYELTQVSEQNCDLYNLKFIYPIKNFYMTDSISRSSKVMAECIAKL